MACLGAARPPVGRSEGPRRSARGPVFGLEGRSRGALYGAIHSSRSGGAADAAGSPAVRGRSAGPIAPRRPTLGRTQKMLPTRSLASPKPAPMPSPDMMLPRKPPLLPA